MMRRTQVSSMRHAKSYSVAAMLVSLGLASSAHAQDPVAVDRQASDGVERTIHDISGEGDASSIELNPALLSDIRGFDATIRAYVGNDPYARGEGVGAFFGAGAMGFAAGFAVQVLRPGFDPTTFDSEAALQPEAVKLGGALSAGDPDRGSVGIGVHALRAQGQWLREPDIDFGGVARLTNYASLGLTARLSPVGLRPLATRSHLSFDTELAIRPLGTRWLELAGGVRARVDQQNGRGLSTFGTEDLLGHGRLMLRWQGLRLAAEVEQVPVVRLDENTLVVESRERALRAGFALGLDWDYAGAEVGVHAGPNAGVGGTSLAFSLGTERRGRAVWMRPVDVERIDLAQVTGERALLRLLARVERAEAAGGRSILLLDARGVGMGWSSMQELRQALVRARNAGVHIYAYLENADLSDYYLASVAQGVFVHPGGELAVYGLSSTGLYFRDLLAKIGVRVEAMHIREYKSAHEQFSRADRSTYDREQREALLDTQFETFVYDVAQARKTDLGAVRKFVDGSPWSPEQALEAGFVDAVLHRDEILRTIGDDLEMSVQESKFDPLAPERETWSKAPYFAVLVVEGTIRDGKSLHVPFLNLHFSGGDTIAKQLQALREDPACKGIVLRVNSPGGSALASEIIHREVERTYQAHERDAKSNPPIVISMSDVAASGGYYIAAGARQVFAMPTTITGSIGVVSLHFDVSQMLEKLGVGVDTISRGEMANADSIFKPFTELERERLEASMQRVYDLFRKRVADARGMTLERVDEIGRGHVYSGRDAKAIDLIDDFGGLDASITWLRSQSAHQRRFPPIEVRVFPKYEGLLSLILEDFGPVGEKLERARAKSREGRLPTLPKALSLALARLPLSLLYLEQGDAQLITPWVLERSGTTAAR